MGMLPGNKKFLLVDKEFLISGFATINNIFKTSLGPYGKLKLLYFSNNKLYITKDSKLILDKIKFGKTLNFFIKNMVHNYYSNIHDGVISLIIITSSMIKNIDTAVYKRSRIEKN